MITGRQKVLIVGPSWVGDMVMAQSLFKVLQQTRPGVAIDVLAPAWSEPILSRMPEVRSAIALPLKHGEVSLGRRRRLGRRLRAAHYDQAILLPNSLKSALVPLYAGIGRRTGWRGEMRVGLLNDLRVLKKSKYPLMVQRFVALGLDRGAALPAKIPAPRLVVDTRLAEACRSKFELAGDRPILALCPGAEFGSAKRWPLEYYAALARQYLQRGWQIALYGSANDEDVCRQIREGCELHPLCFDLSGRTSLAEAVDMLSLSAAVVSNDSGLMHIAAALSCPMVVIYGATSPDFTPPLDRKADVLVSDIDCAPCFERECPLQHHRCMRELPVTEVAAKLDALLSEFGG